METPPTEIKERTTLVQSVVPVSLAERLDKDARTDGRSTSNFIANIIKAHYAAHTSARKPRKVAA